MSGAVVEITDSEVAALFGQMSLAPKNRPAPQKCENFPPELRALPRWVCWRKVIRDGKSTKIPVDPHTGSNAAANDPGTWGGFDDAQRRLKADSTLAGLGFMFNGDGIMGADLDHVIDATGNLDPEAARIVADLNTYTERSQSGTGLHMICKASLPEGKGRRKGTVELYCTGRFFVMTGDRWAGTPATIEPRQTEVDSLLARLFPPEKKTEPQAPRAPVSMSDRDLIDKASNAKNGDLFKALWAGQWQGRYDSQSSADAALLGMLRFWAGGDRERSFAMFEKSGLMRDKWKRDDYRESTWAAIDKGDTYNPDHAPVCVVMGKRLFSFATEAEAQRFEIDNELNPGSLKRVEGAALDAWEPPIGFDSPVNLPLFPVEVLPEPFKAFVSDVAASKQVPADLPGALVLGAVALAAAKRYRVYIGKSHQEPLNLFLLALLDPGSRKSDTFRACLCPVEDAEIERAHAAAEIIAKARERRAVEEARLAELRKRAGREDDPHERRRLTIEAEELAANMTEIPAPPRLLAGDISPEHLATLLCSNNGRMAVADAEGALIFEIIGGKYSKGGNPNCEIFLKGHAGDAVRVDRTGRSPDFTRSAALTCILTAQPAILKSLPAKEQMRGRGLLARFLFSIPAGLIGSRTFGNRPMDAHLVDEYAARLRALLAVELLDPDNPEACRRLSLDGDALAIWAKYADEIERAQAPDGELSHMTDFASKLAGTAARMAGILHLMQHGPDGPENIAPSTVAGAWALAMYFLKHTKGAFAELGTGGDMGLARRVYGWIARNRPERFTLGRLLHDLRDLDSVANEAAIDGAMRILENRSLVRREPDAPKSRPGRKSFGAWEVNPAILRGDA